MTTIDMSLSKTRATDQSPSRLNRVLDEMKELKKELAMLKQPSKVEINTKRAKLFIDERSIVLIEAQSNYSTIYVENGESHLTSKTLKYWESRISSEHILRIHASYIINTSFVHQIHLKEREILLINNLTAKAAKSKLKALCEYMTASL